MVATTTGEAKLGLLARRRGRRDGRTGHRAVSEALAAARPDIIVNQMTGLVQTPAGRLNPMKADGFFAPINRLRIEGWTIYWPWPRRSASATSWRGAAPASTASRTTG